MSQGERIILKDDKGKQYELIRVLDLDTKKIIDDLSALVVKKDKIIDWLVEEIHSIVNLGKFIDININKLDTKEEIKKYFEKRCK